MQDENMIVIVAAAAVGLLLLTVGGNEKTETNSDKQGFDVSAYEDKLEERLRGIVEQISGAGNVEIMIAFSSAVKHVYANSEKTDTGSGGESSESELIIVDSSDGGSPVLITEIMPEVKGAAVICAGAKDPLVREKIVYTVMTVLNINSAQIYVTY